MWAGRTTRVLHSTQGYMSKRQALKTLKTLKTLFSSVKTTILSASFDDKGG